MLISTLLIVIPVACGDQDRERAEAPQDPDIAVETEGGEPTTAAGTRLRLAVDTLADAGAYLTDGAGRAVYLFTADSASVSTCRDACAEAWPPLLAEGDVATAQPLRQDLVGTIPRDDGRQVTYGGHPLYYYVEDSGPGRTTGQDVHGFGGEWYLVTPTGDVLESEN